MSIRMQISEGVCMITVPTRFDFSSHRAFRDAYQASLTDSAVDTYLIDFKENEYLDSAALGMLLLLRRLAQEAGKKVALQNARDLTREILDIAHFQQLFEYRN